MYAVALMALTYVWRVQDMITPLAAIKFPTVIGLTALAMYAADKMRIRRVRFIRSPVVALVFAFASIIIAGVPTSLLASSTFEFLIKDFLPSVIMAVLVGACVRGMRDLDWLLGIHTLGATLYAVYVLLFFNVDATGRLEHLLYYDSNDLALATVSTLPVTIYFLRDRSPRWQRRMALCVLPLLLFNFVRAGSRGGFLGLITITVCLVFSYGPVKPRRRIAAVALIIGAISIAGGAGFWDKMKTILSPDEDYNMQSETGRWQIWQNGLSIVRQRPFLGVGARQFPEAEATLSDLGRERIESRDRQLPWQAAHNSYISVAAETGLFGFVLFVSLLLTNIGTALKMTRVARASGAGELAALSTALAIAFAGYAVCAFFLTAEYQAILYLNIGFLLAARKLVKVSKGPQATATVDPIEPYARSGGLRWRQA